jgi:hypothetical protein
MGNENGFAGQGFRLDTMVSKGEIFSKAIRIGTTSEDPIPKWEHWGSREIDRRLFFCPYDMGTGTQ